MTKPLRIDFVSDVSCPWCAIGLGGLEQALTNVGDLIEAELHFQPFELNPAMPYEGQNIVEHITGKYGTTPEQSAATRAMIKERAAMAGFRFQQSDESRIYNTFDAHRLLHWAGLEGRQAELKRALFEAYFTDNKNPGDREVLVAAAAKVGLDAAKAREVLDTGAYAQEVREAEEFWRQAGVNSVPAVIINQKWLISGGQPAEAFEQALRNIAEQV